MVPRGILSLNFQSPDAPGWLSVNVRVTELLVFVASSFGGRESIPKSGVKEASLMFPAVSTIRTGPTVVHRLLSSEKTRE